MFGHIATGEGVQKREADPAGVGVTQRGEAHQHEPADRPETRAVPAVEPHEHRLVALLGEETARVLEAAAGAPDQAGSPPRRNSAPVPRA